MADIKQIKIQVLPISEKDDQYIDRLVAEKYGDAPVAKLTRKEEGHYCECGASWGIEEIDSNKCDSCGGRIE